MKKIIICVVFIMIFAIIFTACSVKDNKEELSSTEVEITSVESVSHILTADKLDNILYYPEDAFTYLDPEYDSQKENGEYIEFYNGDKLVKTAKYENNLLIEKNIYSDDNYTINYEYENGQLSKFKLKGENSCYINGIYKNGLVSSFSYLIKNGDDFDFFAGVFDENGNLTEKMDNFEEFSNTLESAIYEGIIDKLKESF